MWRTFLPLTLSTLGEKGKSQPTGLVRVSAVVNAAYPERMHSVKPADDNKSQHKYAARTRQNRASTPAATSSRTSQPWMCRGSRRQRRGRPAVAIAPLTAVTHASCLVPQSATDSCFSLSRPIDQRTSAQHNDIVLLCNLVHDGDFWPVEIVCLLEAGGFFGG